MDNNQAFSNNALGIYTTNGFSISLNKDIDLFVNEENDEFEVKIEEVERSKIAIFIHEYWHYLLNISTYAGYRDFSVWFHILVVFSLTLTKHENGKSSGNEDITNKEIEFLKTLYKMQQIYKGSNKINHVPSVNSYQIVGYKNKTEKLEIHNRETTLSYIILNLKLESTFGEKNIDYILGRTAIEEGLVSIVEKMVYSETPESPLFPYSVVDKLIQYLTNDSLPKTDLLAILTLALLTPNPGNWLIGLIQFYDSNCRDVINSNDRRMMLIAKVKDGFEQGANVIEKELDEIKPIVENRAAFQLAASTFLPLFKRMIDVRKDEYLFDLEPFLSGELSEQKLEEFISRYKPCDVIQSRDGNRDKVEKDWIIHFVDKRNDDTTTLKPFQAALAYVSSHICNEGFKSSEEAECKCPFYTVCGLSYRKNYPSLCKKKPWELFEIQGDKLCWFNQGVASLLGTSKIDDN